LDLTLFIEVPLDNSPPTEHRSTKRFPGSTIGPLLLRAESVTLSFSVKVRDVSIQGVGLIAHQCFASGTSLSVEAGPSESLPTELTATVRYAKALPDGRWLLGCSFSRHLTLDDFAVLG
jgi:hypothetical protein